MLDESLPLVFIETYHLHPLMVFLFFLFFFQLKADIAELRKFHEQASRQKVKDILFIDIRKLETELTRLHEAEESAKKDNANESSANQPTKPATAAAPVYTEEIRTYGELCPDLL